MGGGVGGGTPPDAATAADWSRARRRAFSESANDFDAAAHACCRSKSALLTGAMSGLSRPSSAIVMGDDRYSSRSRA